MNIRAIAAKTLAPVIACKGSLSSSFDNQIGQLPEKDKGLFQELCFGSLRHFFELKLISEQLLSKPLKSKDSDIFALVLIGLYQIRYMRVPDHAAISETVDATKKLKKNWASKLVNAVLRNYLREQEKESDSLFNKLAKDSSFIYNHPYWLVKQIKKYWPDDWKDILSNNNQLPPLTLRVNRQQISEYDYLAKLTESHIEAEPCTHAQYGISVKTFKDVSKLPGFKSGQLSVQDEAAQLSADLLELTPGLRVLDACCAPGGKTSHILESQPDLEYVTAVELEETRLQRVKDNLERLQLNNQNINLHIADANEVDTWWDGQLFDRILLDAPCSATGVIRRHPDIKLLRLENDLAKLATLQQQLLKALWRILKPGGTLLYATCSVLKCENEEIVESFLAEHSDAKHSPIEANWGQARPIGRQLFPQRDGHDGFYYARMRKSE